MSRAAAPRCGRVPLVSAVTIVLLSATCTSAMAAGVRLTSDTQPGFSRAVVLYSADPGERNHVAIEQSGDTVVVRDPGAQIAAGESCSSIDPHTASCAKPSDLPLYALSLEVRLDDGDDSVTAAESRLVAHGGPGADRLTGSPTRDYLSGGPGRDVLSGAGGDDTLRDQESDKDVSSRPASDRIDGGDGVDIVSYGKRATGVTIDLARGTETGSHRERDTLVAIEHAQGGFGLDVLVGDAGPNRLISSALVHRPGKPGGDRVLGRGGDDELAAAIYPGVADGGPGDDKIAVGARGTARGRRGDDQIQGFRSRRLAGGPGHDVIADLDTVHDSRTRVSCGDGRDRVEEPPAHGRVGADCELVYVGGPDLEIALRRAQGELLAKLRRPCPDSARYASPTDLISFRHRRADQQPVLIGTAPKPARCGAPRTPRVRLTSTGRNLLKRVRRDRLAVELRMLVPRSGGESWPPRLVTMVV